MRALHTPSLQEAQFLGWHRGRKASIVRLPNGTTQMWSYDTTQILGKNDMTKKIMMTIAGSRGKMFDVIDRVFETVEEAHEYMTETLKHNDIKTKYENPAQGTSTCKLSNGWTIDCNYSITEILKAKPPQKELTEHYPFDLRRSTAKYKMPTSSSNLNDDPSSDLLSNPKTKNKPTGKLVQLKDLTKDTRKARVILRGLVRQKKIAKPARWEWSEGSNDLAEVKKALGK